jgi:hypothetical protein
MIANTHSPFPTTKGMIAATCGRKGTVRREPLEQAPGMVGGRRGPGLSRLITVLFTDIVGPTGTER